MGFAKYAEDDYEIWIDRMDKRKWGSTYNYDTRSFGRAETCFEENDSIMDVYERNCDTIQFNLLRVW